MHVGERRVRLLKKGRNQLLRIPRDLELPGNEVIVRKEGHRLIVEPVARSPLSAVLASLEPLDVTLPPIERTKAEAVEL